MNPMGPKYYALLAAGVSIAVYISTLSPTISVGDSPELISSAYLLGISHPPGYPVFSLMGKGASLIPIGDSIAYRANLLSAFLGGASVFFLHLSIIEAIGLARRGSGSEVKVRNPQSAIIDHLAAFLAAVTFAFSPIFWSQAVIAEVYTLNSAFFTGLLWLSLRWASEVQPSSFILHPSSLSPDSRLLYLISFLWGLSLGNHHTMIAFGPVFLVFALWRVRESGVGSTSQPLNLSTSFLPLTSHFSLLTFFFLLGLSVYLYLPLRSVQDPFMDWGEPERLGGFLDVIFRRQFGLGGGEYSIERISLQISYLIGLLRGQFTAPGLFLGVIGMLFFAKRGLVPSLFTLSLFLIHGVATVVFLNPAGEDLYSIGVMVIPSFAVFSIWIGMGLLLLSRGAIALFTRGLTEARERKVFLCLVPVFLSIPTVLLCKNFHGNDQSGNTFARDYAEDVLKSVGPNGVLFVDADLSLFPIWYMQYVEGARRDAAVMNVDMLMLPWFKGQLERRYPGVEIKLPDIVKHAGGGRFKPLSMEAIVSYKVSQVEGMLDGLMRRHPVYLSYDFGVPFGEFGERKDIRLVRKGVVFVVSGERGIDEPIGEFTGLRSIVKAVESKDEEVLFIGRAYLPAIKRTALEELSSGRKGRAMELMEAALIVDPYDGDFLNNLAYLYAEDGKDFIKAERMVGKALAINPGERTRYLKTLGFIHLRKGEREKAIEVFKEVLKAEPGSRWTLSRLEEADALAKR